MNYYNLIKEAITNRLQVHFTYKGKQRKTCPHVLGLKHGKEHCLFFQFDGGSNSGLSNIKEDNWRCLDLAHIQDLQLIEGDWHSASNYNEMQSCVDKIHITA
jgi:hypothetical protein